MRLQPGNITTYEQGLIDMLRNHGDQTELGNFLGSWSGASAWLTNNTTDKQRLELVYYTDPFSYLENIINQDLGVIDAAMASEPSMSFAEYGARVINSGYPGAVTTASINTALVSEEFTLSEHHIYGSSRLGIQYYDQAAGGVNTPQYNAVKTKWTAGNNAANATFYNLNQPAVWWSYGYGTLVDKYATSPWGNWQRGGGSSGTTSGSALTGLQNYCLMGRTLGWRQYELSDHLGNVLASVLDRKVGSQGKHDVNGVQFYDYYKPDIASAQDYYPFGMLMPGRQFTLAGMDGRYGFNGQQRSDEVYGKGNLNTALFWEYDTRLARRWNLDPIDQVETSNYAAFLNSPTALSDPHGDCVKCSEEAAQLNRASEQGKIVDGLLWTDVNGSAFVYHKELNSLLPFEEEATAIKINNLNTPPERIESEATQNGAAAVRMINDVTADLMPILQEAQLLSIILTGKSLASDNEYGGSDRVLAALVPGRAGKASRAMKRERQLWRLTEEASSEIRKHRTWGTFYKSASDGTWWARDITGHGGSAIKVFKESRNGLEWIADADQFGTYIIGKHKGATGTSIPWDHLKKVL